MHFTMLLVCCWYAAGMLLVCCWYALYTVYDAGMLLVCSERHPRTTAVNPNLAAPPSKGNTSDLAAPPSKLRKSLTLI